MRLRCVLCCLMGLFVCGFAGAQQILPDVEVTATTSDGSAVMIPFFMLGQPNMPSREAATISSDLDIDQAEYCKRLTAAKPGGCSLSTFPSSPGLPSAIGATWGANGCGASPWSSALGSGYLSFHYPTTYSGDLNNPVSGNPAVEFSSICNAHDECYTSQSPKTTCDTNFMNSLYHSICDYAGASKSSCYDFAMEYVDAVTYHGDGAYADDQGQLACSSWGNAMKASGCGS